jgi:hypothetical protein
MWVVLIGLWMSAWMQAGSVHGVALEHASGRPLARTVVRLEPVGRSGAVLTTRAGRTGYFSFPSVVAGLYLVVAEREGFFPAAYGQRVPAGRGTPVSVGTDSNFYAELRMRRRGAITGRVLDENGVGRPGTTVFAYRARLPLRSVGSGVSDDRGVYRIHGLAPGKYWVRAAAQTLDDGSGWLPTYGPQGREIREARVHRVSVDADTADADVSPEAGALFRVGGKINCGESRGVVLVVLSSETGRRSTETACNFEYSFDGLAPGYYEIYARLRDEAAATGFTEIFLGGNQQGVNILLQPLPEVRLEVRRAGDRGTSSPLDVPVVLIGRRQDLSESEAAREMRGPRMRLAPGHWEFRAAAPDGYYVVSIENPYGRARRRRQAGAADWYEVFIEPSSVAVLRVALSEGSGEIEGEVRRNGTAVAGVPVYLWPVEEAARRSLGGAWQVLAGTDGRFRFGSLPPGEYRVLASFDVSEVDEETVELSQARNVRAEASQKTGVVLEVWEAPW